MPVLLRNRRLADGAGSVAMQPVSASNIGDGGDDLRGHSKAIAPLVPGDVVRDQPEARGQCARPATHSGVPEGGVGLGSYQTAWAWLHKLRRAMVRPGRDLLGGAVEVDETYVGGRETGVVGRQILGLGSYQTAWAWLHKLRRAMVRPGRDLLGGAVEVDETYVGGGKPASWGDRRRPSRSSRLRRKSEGGALAGSE